jgi:hypothetical protein
MTYSGVNEASGSSARSASRRIPLVMRGYTLHNACTVRPKWRPWWTRGSLVHLQVEPEVSTEDLFCEWEPLL